MPTVLQKYQRTISSFSILLVARPETEVSYSFLEEHSEFT